MKARTDSDINVSLHKAITCPLEIEWDLKVLFKGQDQATEGNVHEAMSWGGMQRHTALFMFKVQRCVGMSI